METDWPDKKKMAMVGTVRSHIKNLMAGVDKGFTYKLKIVYAHFPMNVKVGKEVIVENFQGERQPRSVRISKHSQCDRKRRRRIVKGIDLEEVSQAAADIQQATLIKKKDPRVFLDGVYIYEKGGS